MELDNESNFVEVYEDVLDARLCALIIERFESSRESVRGSTGNGVDITLKNSWDIGISGRTHWLDVERALNTAMMSGLARYLRKFPYLLLAPMKLSMANSKSSDSRLNADQVKSMSEDALYALIRATLRPGSINLQKYISDQGGYPYWHCELYPKLGDAHSETLHRTLLWTMYLNDAFSEGETEFLYQNLKVAPKTGALLIAPAAFTHTHRGNMPRGGDKFIATSWVLFHRAEKIYAAK